MPEGRHDAKNTSARHHLLVAAGRPRWVSTRKGFPARTPPTCSLLDISSRPDLNYSQLFEPRHSARGEEPVIPADQVPIEGLTFSCSVILIPWNGS